MEPGLEPRRFDMLPPWEHSSNDNLCYIINISPVMLIRSVFICLKPPFPNITKHIVMRHFFPVAGLFLLDVSSTILWWSFEDPWLQLLNYDMKIHFRKLCKSIPLLNISNSLKNYTNLFIFLKALQSFPIRCM